jgi:hypothetical protein
MVIRSIGTGGRASGRREILAEVAEGASREVRLVVHCGNSVGVGWVGEGVGFESGHDELGDEVSFILVDEFECAEVEWKRMNCLSSKGKVGRPD